MSELDESEVAPHLPASLMADYSLLRASVKVADGTSRTVILRGATGLGKTTLLTRLAWDLRHEGVHTLEATGVRGESDLSYWSLHQLLYPVLGDPSNTDLREQIIAAMCSRSIDFEQRLGLSMTVLHAARARQPRRMVLVIDDGEFVDDATWDLLSFVINRLTDHSVVLVVGVAHRSPPQLAGSRALDLQLKPLSLEAARAVVDEQWPDLPPTVHDRIVEDADGNPLALRELPLALTEAQLTGRELPPLIIPLPPSLTRIYAQAIQALEPQTRTALVYGTVDIGTTINDPGLTTWQPSAEELHPVIEAGLVKRTGRGVMWESRLVRSAVYALTPPQELRSVHKVLAERYRHDPVRAIIHRAASAVEPDEKLAEALMQDAAHIRTFGSPDVALAAMVRAAALSPASEDRARRLVVAAGLALEQGQRDIAQSMLDESALIAETPGQTLVHAVARGRILMHADGDYAAAASLVARSLQTTPDARPADIDAAFQLLARLVVQLDDGTEYDRTRELAKRHMDSLQPLTRALLIASVPGMALDRPVRSILEDLTATTRGTHAEVVSRALSAYLSDYLYLFRSQLRAALDGARAGHAPGPLMSRNGIRHLLSIDALQSGAWAACEDAGHEGLSEAVAAGLGTIANHYRHTLAILAAHRGDTDAAYRLSQEIELWALPRACAYHRSLAIEARMSALLASGNFDEGWNVAQRLLTDGALPKWPRFGSRTVLDVVELALRSGHVEAATEIAATSAAGVSELHPERLQALVAAARALTSPAAEVRAHFDAALRVDELARWPFERARIHLLFGEWLRRQLHMNEARDQLSKALDVFDMLGASPWARRAHLELRAAGRSERTRGVPDSSVEQRALVALTPQELEIATLAAQGLTNKAIASRLFLSPRTVSGHLYRIFPKLGVAARAELRDVLARLDPVP